MAQDDHDKSARERLRHRAESSLRLQPIQLDNGGWNTERLRHELDVHGVELEIQNDELRATQTELARSRDRYRELFDFAPVGYVTLNRRGLIFEANSTLAKLLGVERARLEGSPLGAYMSEVHADRLQLALTEAFAIGTSHGCEFVLECQTPDGSRERTVHFTCLAVAGPKVSYPECRAAITDLTDIREAEARQRAARSETSAVLDTVSDAIVGSDSSGQIESFNRAAERLFGYQRQEVIGKNVRLLMPSPYREQHDLYLLRYVSTGKAHIIGKPNREVTGLRKDGTTFPLELGIGEWWDRGRQKFTAIIHDLSERKRTEGENARLEAQLSHAQKLEAVGTLASGVAHDFSNLLMGIGGCASIALDKLPADSPVRPYVSEVKRSADSGASISKRLLLFSRKESAERRTFELNKVVTAVETMLGSLLGENIHLRTRLDAADSRVHGDAHQLEQVLVNLAVNARDAMPLGGMLLLETTNVSLEVGNPALLRPGDFVALKVSDNGIGMSEATRQRIFEPFFTTKDPARGTGLGLSTVHGIIEQSGGHVRVESRPDEGTTFEILLPRSDQPPSTDSVLPPASKSELPKRDGITVLVVEDDAAVRMGIRHYLEQGGCRVVEASNGPEAVAYAQLHLGALDVVLTDVVLPDMGGAEIAAKLQATDARLRVLFMSAHPRGWLESQGRLPPGARLLQKPFGAETLLKRLHRELHRRPVPAGSSASTAPVTAKADRTTLLIVEDEAASRLALSGHFEELGWHVLAAADGGEAVELCRASAAEVDVLLVDYMLPKLRGDRVAREVLKSHPHAALVYMSGYPDLKPDPPGLVLVKPLELDAVATAVERLVAHQRIRMAQNSSS